MWRSSLKPSSVAICSALSEKSKSAAFSMMRSRFADAVQYWTAYLAHTATCAIAPVETCLHNGDQIVGNERLCKGGHSTESLRNLENVHVGRALSTAGRDNLGVRSLGSHLHDDLDTRLFGHVRLATEKCGQAAQAVVSADHVIAVREDGGKRVAHDGVVVDDQYFRHVCSQRLHGRSQASYGIGADDQSNWLCSVVLRDG
jgi:hypothetical protein